MLTPMQAPHPRVTHTPHDWAVNILYRGDADAHRFALSLLIARVTSDEILHIHPAAQAKAAQHDRLALPIDDLVAANS